MIGQLDLFAAMVHDRLADADWSTKRDIICTLVKRIEVTADRVRIVFRVDPGSSAPSEPRRNLPYCPHVVILHRMLRDGSEFRWSTKEVHAA